MKKSRRFLVALVALATSACDHARTTEVDSTTSVDGMTVSNPSSPSTPTGGVLLTSLTTAPTVSYISLAPNSINARQLIVQNKTQGLIPVVIALVDGGFDPIPVIANPDDALEMTFTLIDGVTFRAVIKAPARRNPGIVRTDPAKGRVDVALNVGVSVVFTEPINPQTITPASVRLLLNGSPVNGKLEVFNSVTVTFTPAVPLVEGTTYQIVVTPEVRDRDGDQVETAFTSTFTTSSNISSGCAIPSGCPPFPHLTGQIIERTSKGTRLVNGLAVWAWVQHSDGSGYNAGGLQTDSLGNYQADFLPDATILIGALGVQTEQPCAATVTLKNDNATLDFELEDSDDPLPDLHTTPPVVKGTIYEQTAAGKKPVPHAKVWFEPALDVIGATTTSDKDGRYALCNLPAFWSIQSLTVTADGYQTWEKGISVSAGIIELDIELKR